MGLGEANQGGFGSDTGLGKEIRLPEGEAQNDGPSGGAEKGHISFRR